MTSASSDSAEFQDLRVEVFDRFVLVTLDRPRRLNALSYSLWCEIDRALDIVEARGGDCGCVVFTGSGKKAFSAGADIHELLGTSSEETNARSEHIERVIRRVADFPLPTIGAINGLAYGAGALLASTFDIRIGSDRASFRFLAAAYGRINSTWTLPHIVGYPRAKEAMLTARVIEAEEALSIGLLTTLVVPDDLMSAARSLVDLIVANNIPALADTKRLLNEGIGMSIDDQYALEWRTMNENPRPSFQEAFAPFIGRKS